MLLVVSSFFVLYIFIRRFIITLSKSQFQKVYLLWDKELFSYFRTEQISNEFKQSVSKRPQIFLKYLLNYMEFLNGREKELLFQFVSDVNLRNQFHMLLYTHMETTDETLRESLNHLIKCRKSSREILSYLYDFNDASYDQLFLLFLTLKDSYRLSLLVEYVTYKQFFLFDEPFIILFQNSNHLRLKLKIIDYFLISGNPALTRMVKEALFKEENVWLKVSAVKYCTFFKELTFSEYKCLISQTRSVFLWEECLSGLKQFDLFKGKALVSCGRLTSYMLNEIKGA